MIRNDDGLVGTRKEAIVAYFRYYPGIYLEGLLETMKKPKSG
jgi:hypothetical protein